jgi:3-methyl-2-oxobutanoate hydroxymethyltransferase
MNGMNLLKLRKMKAAGEKIVMITAYDYPGARMADEAGVDIILVGDSLGTAVLGYENTLSVTMNDMIHHTKAVTRAVKQAMVISDLPFMSYQVSVAEAVANAGRFLQEAGAHGVKLEGGTEMIPAVNKIIEAGIPVIGHLGFTPQSVHRIGGALFQGKTAAKAVQLLEEALRLEDAGVFALVLELVPLEAAELISSRLQIPTIGIGSGPKCDGQVLVYHDLLGLNMEFQPKHSRVFADAGQVIREGISNYVRDVRWGNFPTASHTKMMEPAELEELGKISGGKLP